MKGKLRWIAGAAAVLAAAACATAAPKVPVSAGPGGSDALVGLWEGSYDNAALGRGGSIVFHLDAGRDTAQGDVVMIPRGSSIPFRRWADVPGGGRPTVMPPLSEPLTIRFVRVEGAHPRRAGAVLRPRLQLPGEHLLRGDDPRRPYPGHVPHPGTARHHAGHLGGDAQAALTAHAEERRAP